MMDKKYKIKLGENYNDCGTMLYDMKNQKEITAGGSGPVCSALVTYGYIYNEMKNKNLKKVLRSIKYSSTVFFDIFLIVCL